MLDVPKTSEKSFADGKILQGVSDGVGVITFNNPEKRNAMSLEMWQGLGSALIELRDDPDVRVVILKHVPAKWNPVRRQGHAATLESTAFPDHIGSQVIQYDRENAVVANRRCKSSLIRARDPS